MEYLDSTVGVSSIRYLLKKYPLVLLIWTFLIYSNTLGNQFAYDDAVTIKENLLIKDISNITWLISPKHYWLSGEGSYRPLVTLTYIFDHYLWTSNPFGYHLTNLLLHIFNVSSLYLLTLRLWNNKRLGFIASSIFALTPVNSEAVNAISFREDLLITSFCLWSLIHHQKSLDTGRYGRLHHYLSVLLYFLALFSKEMAITLPLLAILIDIHINRNIRFGRYVSYGVVALFYFYLEFYLFHNPREILTTGAGILSRISAAPSVYHVYIKLFLLPIGLSADHVYKIPLGDCYLMLLLILSPLFVRSAEIKVSILWFIIALIPVLNIIEIEHPVAERHIYLPAVGLSIYFAYIGDAIVKNRSGFVFGLSILLLFSLLTLERNKAWKTDYSLWSDTVRKSPESSTANNNLGKAHKEMGEVDKAEEYYRTALKLRPSYPEALNNIGIVYYEKGDLDKAEGFYKAALRSNPNHAESHHNLGTVYLDKGLHENALMEYNTALSLKPNYAEAYYNIGNLFYKEGRIDDALTNYDAASEIKPDMAGPYFKRGNIFFGVGKLKKALTELQTAARLNPNSPEIRYNIGVVYSYLGDSDMAGKEFEVALRLKPDYIAARKALELLSSK